MSKLMLWNNLWINKRLRHLNVCPQANRDGGVWPDREIYILVLASIAVTVHACCSLKYQIGFGLWCRHRRETWLGNIFYEIYIDNMDYATRIFEFYILYIYILYHVQQITIWNTCNCILPCRWAHLLLEQCKVHLYKAMFKYCLCLCLWYFNVTWVSQFSCKECVSCRDPFRRHGLTLIPALERNYTH